MELEDMLCPAMPHPCWTCGRSEERPISLNEAAGDLAAGDMVPPFFWWTWCFAPSSLSSPCSDSCFAFGGSPSPLGSHAWIATSSLALWRRFCCVLGRPGRAVMLRHSYPAFKRRLVCCFCVASQNGGNLRKEPHLERHLRLVCSFESPLASQAWELLKSTSSSLTLHWVWFVASLQEIEHRVALLLLQGRCPFRDLDEAQQACQSCPDLVLLRRAPDCHALRKAYHDGQRQVHPDLLRLQHPACAAELLQACSVALNLAFDTRRHELNCPGAR
ncbi:unnamed protein product [Durusdinium trenchii]|uniref:Uncharacterized protein n=1 Tax=Durusdinium trenchii TaxID=1381693 RepID=A0ABP0SBL4_9DINO